MSSVSDESPVTVGSLREELDARFARYPTRDELEQRLSTLATKADIEERFATKQDLETWGFAIAARLEAHFELVVQRVMKIVGEQHTREISVLDDKYRDLPTRVERLEGAVFPRKRTRRR